MKFIFLFTLASLLLAGCSREGETVIEPALQPVQIREADSSPEVALVPEPSLEEEESVPESTTNTVTNDGHWPDREERLDVQGAVETVVIPLNLNSPTESLNFEVTLNTHSVDLGMDLATLASLETDNGLSVSAVTWDAPVGGHHIGGVLSFPTELDGSALLDNASRVTLIIRDVDAPMRAFSWVTNE